MSMQPPSPQQLYIPPAPPPAPAPPMQQPQGTPGQFAQQGSAGAPGGGGTPSFLASAAPAPATTGQRSLLGA